MEGFTELFSTFRYQVPIRSTTPVVRRTPWFWAECAALAIPAALFLSERKKSRAGRPNPDYSRIRADRPAPAPDRLVARRSWDAIGLPTSLLAPRARALRAAGHSVANDTS